MEPPCLLYSLLIWWIQNRGVDTVVHGRVMTEQDAEFVEAIGWFPWYFIVTLPRNDCPLPFSFQKKRISIQGINLESCSVSMSKDHDEYLETSYFLFPFHCLMDQGLGNGITHRGPFSNNQADESIRNGSWLKSIDSLKWKTETPLGFSSFTTEKDQAFTLVAEEDEDGLMREICISLNLSNGKRNWSTLLGIMDYKAGGGNSGAPDKQGGRRTSLHTIGTRWKSMGL